MSFETSADNPDSSHKNRKLSIFEKEKNYVLGFYSYEKKKKKWMLNEISNRMGAVNKM